MREKQLNTLYFKCIRYDKIYLWDIIDMKNRKMETKM